MAAIAALVHHTVYSHGPEQSQSHPQPLWIWWWLAFLCPSVIILYYVMIASSLKSYVNFFSIWVHAVVPSYIIAVIVTHPNIRRFIANKDVVRANLELVAVLAGGTAWGFINYFSDGIPPYAAVKQAPEDLALQVSAVAWCVIACGALLMALCWQIEQVVNAEQDGSGERETTSGAAECIAGHL